MKYKLENKCQEQPDAVFARACFNESTSLTELVQHDLTSSVDGHTHTHNLCCMSCVKKLDRK